LGLTTALSRQLHIAIFLLLAVVQGCFFVLTSRVDSDITTIHLPKELANRIHRRLVNSDFKNMDDYVAYVLGQILDEIEGTSPQKNQEVFSKKEQGDVEEHLRSLGYM